MNVHPLSERSAGSVVEVRQPIPPHVPHHAPPVRGHQLCWTQICPKLPRIRIATGFAIVKAPCYSLLVLLLLNLAALSSGGLGHNFNHKPAFANPFVVWKKSGACVPHILLILGSSEKDHDFWDGVARGKVAAGTCCWKWQLRKADWNTLVTTREKSEDSEDRYASLRCIQGVCVFVRVFIRLRVLSL